MKEPGYRELLWQELQARKRQNSAYSLRALARAAAVSPGYLSQLLHKQRSLNEDRAFRIATRLNWSAEKRRLFVDLVRYERIRDLQAKQDWLKRIQPTREKIGNKKRRAVFSDEIEVVLDRRLVPALIRQIRAFQRRLLAMGGEGSTQDRYRFAVRLERVNE